MDLDWSTVKMTSGIGTPSCLACRLRFLPVGLSVDGGCAQTEGAPSTNKTSTVSHLRTNREICWDMSVRPWWLWWWLWSPELGLVPVSAIHRCLFMHWC